MATIADGFGVFASVLQYSWLWFNRILVAADAVTWWLAMFFTYTIFRLFIFPLVGSMSSDSVRNFKKGNKK